MANIPPQENWFTISAKGATANSAGTVLGNQTYTCPRNRNAIITSWYFDEIADGSTIVACYSPVGATTAPGALDYYVQVGPPQYYDPSAPGYTGWNALNLNLGPGDQFFIGVTVSDGSASWDSCFSVREIGPSSGNMGESTGF